MRPSESSAPSSPSRLLRLLQRRRRRRIEKRQRGGIADAPLREVEHQRGQIGGEDFRLGVGGERRGLRLVPQPVADAGLGAAGAAAALIDRGARGAHGLQPRQADVGLVARHPRQAGIDHDADALDGQRGLGDRGRQHHLALALRRRRDGAVLHGGVERAEQRHDLDRSHRESARRENSACGGFRRHPAGTPAPSRDRRAAPSRSHPPSAARAAHRPCGRDSASRPERRGLRWQSTGASPSSLPTRAPSSVADITRMRRSSRKPGLRVARQRQAQIGIERTLVKFVEQHGGDAGQFGIVENLPRENALGDDLDPRRARDLGAEADAIADGLAGALAERLRHPLGAGARRDPARLQHDDLLALQPRRIEQRQRHPRGLAGAGRRHQHGGVVGRERAREFVEHRVDRERGVEAAGQ